VDNSQPEGRRVAVDLSEGFGERLMGRLLDRGHQMPPQLIAPLVELTRGDRVLFFTDGLIEEHRKGGELFGERRMVDTIEQIGPLTGGVGQMARRLSHALMRNRGGTTSDDATLFLVEWQGGAANQLAFRDF